MNTQGIGLGLVISENIVKCFDGQIGVRSRFGKGSHFAFCIALDSMEDDDENYSLNWGKQKVKVQKIKIQIKS